MLIDCLLLICFCFVQDSSKLVQYYLCVYPRHAEARTHIKAYKVSKFIGNLQTISAKKYPIR